MATLAEQILSGKSETEVEPSVSLADTVLSTPNADLPKAVEQFDIQSKAKANREGFVQGLHTILNTVGQGIGQIDKAFIPGGEERNKAFQSRVDAENKDFDTKYPEGEGLLPTGPRASKMLGEMVATAPLTPMRAIQGVRGALGALPTITATGEKIAAPFLNKAAASAVTGAATGAEFGALTSSGNDKSLGENTGVGLITGAIAGPVLTTAASAGKSLLPIAKNLWANVQIGKIAQQAGMEPAAVKNVVSILENAGYTPQEAQLALNKLGPNATLTDLANSIQTESSGLASIGGKPTELLKGRYEARAKTANSEAHQIMETKLGPKPDIEAEKEAIVKQVQKDTGPDYKAAHANPVGLDIQSVIDDIDKQLKTAVGPKEAALKHIKGFLFKTEKDASGKEIQVVKHRVDELHEVRQAIDDVINDKNPTTSYGKNALNSIEGVRSGIDAELKTVPEMAAADNKFAKQMEIVNHIKIGEDALKRGMNKEEFARFFDGLSPEKQAAVKKGMRSAVGDAMEFASRGELSEAQRLFGKSSTNRANLEKVFGARGTEVLDALEKEAMFRGSEQKVIHGAQTAERQSVQRKYGERNDGPGAGQILHGAALDLVTGTPGGATALMTIKRAGSHVGLKISEGRRERLIEGTSDLLSRQGAERDASLGTLNRIKAVQDSLKPKFKLSLPTKTPTYLLSAPAGQLGFSAYKKLGQE